MNRKQLILLLAVLAVLGGAYFLLRNHNEDSWTPTGGKIGQKVMGDFPVNDITAIHIQGDGEINLARKDDRWRVRERNDYPANFSQISDVLLKVKYLKISQEEPIGASQLARMQLEEPGKGPNAATLLSFKDANGKALPALLLGKKHTQTTERAPSPYGGGEQADGRFVMLESDPHDVLTVSDPLGDVTTKPADWLDKAFFKVEKPRLISFVSTNEADSWTLTRASETGPWSLSNTKTNEVLDTNKVASFSSTLGYPSFVDVVTDAAPAKTGMEKPLMINIQTFDGFNYAIKIGNKTPENDYDMNVVVTGDLPAKRVADNGEKPEDAKKLDTVFADKQKPLAAKLAQEKSLASWTYLVNGWLIDPLIRTRAQLMVEKKPITTTTAEPAPAAPGAEMSSPKDLPDIQQAPTDK